MFFFLKNTNFETSTFTTALVALLDKVITAESQVGSLNPSEGRTGALRISYKIGRQLSR